MERREFLRRGLTLSAGLAAGGIPGLLRWAEGNEGGWRRFEVTTRIEVVDPVGAVRAWVPVPLLQDTGYFKREGDSWSGNFKAARSIQYDRYGTGMVFAEWSPGEKSPVLEVTSRFATRDRHVDLSAKPDRGVREDKAVLDYFRRPSRLIRTDGIVAATARGIVQGARSDKEKARAIYEWIVENTFRDPKIRGCGIGDITTMLQTGYLGGKCADLNALYVGLARAAGLAARDVYGVRCAASSEFKSLGKADDITSAQHCRAEVFLSGYGWVPVDPADVRKVVLEEDQPAQLPLDHEKVKKARAKLFGAWEMNWLPYNYAHDVKLPHSNGPELGFLMYPQTETANGRKDSLDPKNFSYTIKVRQV
ncbi:MAG TPA: transglutaminase-like domain-containing protein [candidate division Zixibacteria bacterium]|nr:transglutaminase-like domain-containing protein [candidate division Zixibacteria bacterium]